MRSITTEAKVEVLKGMGRPRQAADVLARCLKAERAAAVTDTVT